MGELTLQEMADLVEGELIVGPAGDDVRIRGINGLEVAQGHEVTFSQSVKHVTGARCSGAGAVLVHNAIEDLDKAQLVVADVEAAVTKILYHFSRALIPPPPGIHPSAILGEGVQVGEGISIGAHVTIEDQVVIGSHTVISAGCCIGQESTIGDHTHLGNNVVIYHRSTIGNHVVIQANTTIGAIGFGYTHEGGQHHLVPHNGGVIIEDFVEIGANCCIDRAKFTNTIVGAGTKMDNMVQIGHNVVIGKCCLLAAQSGVAGSTVLGDGVIIGGQAGIADHLKVANGTMLGGKSGLMKSITEPGKKLVWVPAMEQKEALRVMGELYRLPKTLKRFVERLERLEVSKDDKG